LVVIIIVIIRTKFAELPFLCAGPVAWNRLLHDICASTSLNIFKQKLKTHIFAEAFSH